MEEVLTGESLGRPGEIEGTRCLGPGHARHSEGALSLAVTLRYMQCFSVAAAFVEDETACQPACRPPSDFLRTPSTSADRSRLDFIKSPLRNSIDALLAVHQITHKWLSEHRRRRVWRVIQSQVLWLSNCFLNFN